MAQKIGRPTAEKTKRNPIPHHRCNGTGYGTKVYAKCRGCNGTGDAAIAFEKEITSRHLTRPIDQDFDDIIDAYLYVRYGIRKDTVVFDEEDQRAAQAFTVLQHAADRSAADTIIRLSGPVALFPWFVEQERTLLADHKPEDFTW